MITQESNVPVVFLTQNDRFAETENSVYFFKTGRFSHKSFVNTYRGMTTSQVRRKCKTLCNAKRQQREIIHYLREKGLLVDFKYPIKK
jgi:hypothetical protein